MTEIKAVKAKENYQLEVNLTNGSMITLNLKPKLETIRFGLLRDEAFFQRAETDGRVISWGNKVELSTSEVFDMIKK
ncbi:DUF2442 domain-containing protein [Eubacteriaceae bacterium ES3]|nr:DUF2442 domain-containing protein [Eubacteriaceae bacterium ES3]